MFLIFISNIVKCSQSGVVHVAEGENANEICICFNKNFYPIFSILTVGKPFSMRDKYFFLEKLNFATLDIQC